MLSWARKTQTSPGAVCGQRRCGPGCHAGNLDHAERGPGTAVEGGDVDVVVGALADRAVELAVVGGQGRQGRGRAGREPGEVVPAGGVEAGPVQAVVAAPDDAVERAVEDGERGGGGARRRSDPCEVSPAGAIEGAPGESVAGGGDGLVVGVGAGGLGGEAISLACPRRTWRVPSASRATRATDTPSRSSSNVLSWASPRPCMIVLRKEQKQSHRSRGHLAHGARTTRLITGRDARSNSKAQHTSDPADAGPGTAPAEGGAPLPPRLLRPQLTHHPCQTWLAQPLKARV
ncbi:hypothetical protein FBY35_2841 [Streptomyces sp. SLBN-118]|nr:hypothetical protein FBY35_2841 [Streptomyces sp. SLBN-118]